MDCQRETRAYTSRATKRHGHRHTTRCAARIHATLKTHLEVRSFVDGWLENKHAQIKAYYSVNMIRCSMVWTMSDSLGEVTASASAGCTCMIFFPCSVAPKIKLATHEADVYAAFGTRRADARAGGTRLHLSGLQLRPLNRSALQEHKKQPGTRHQAVETVLDAVPS